MLDADPGPRERGIERRLQRPVTHHITESRQVLLCCVQPRCTEAAALRNVDRDNRRDRLRRRRQITPHAEALEDESRRVGERQRTIPAQACLGRSRIDSDDIDLAAAERQRVRRADRSGTNDYDLVEGRH